MKRAVSPVTIETEDGVTETIEIIQQDEKKMRTENDELMIDEGVVYEEEVIQPQQPPPQYQNLIIQHMDIAEPLSTLKKLLEVRLQCCLSDHLFFLQDSIQLDENKSLVDQCVQGDGMVQINLEVKSQPAGVPAKINILDILKTAEELEEEQTLEEARTVNPPITATKEEPDNITRWIVDQNFRREQERLKIPYDPFLWSEVHVKHWIQWAIKEFDLQNVMIDNFSITGKQLCELTHPAFIKLIPHDPGDIFWTHLELLRKCKFVAVMQQPTPQAITTITVSTSDTEHRRGTSKSWRPRSPRITGDERLSPGNRTGNNGQIQLWQFLLELLTDKDCREIIMWVGDEGEFKLNNPEMVAQMWGQRKNKPTMNYEKLSRALRYYYDGDMIAKVHGKRFVYKFVCDLKMLLGYSAGELNRLVSECVDRKLHSSRDSVRQIGLRRVVEQKTQTVQTM